VAPETPIKTEHIRAPKTRAPRMPSVIDVQEAEIIQEPEIGGFNIPLPRVRPVVTAPPQVRTLG
jgi:hypothetical protein